MNHRMLPLLALSIAAATAAHAAENRAGKSSAMRLDDVLWREVQNREGERLGSITDVLVQMPTGRVVFVAVLPSEFFERPKAVPPAALMLPADSEKPARLDLPTDRWIFAPRLDWDAALVIKNSEEGGKIYGFYHQAWEEPEPGRPWGMIVEAEPGRKSPAARYVSLKKLLLNRVVTNAGEQAGFIRDFRVDWSARRATHALVSPQFTPLADADDTWFLIPTSLLNPPVEHDAIAINGDRATLRRARNLQSMETIPVGNPAEIFRVPAVAKSGDSAGRR